jgi:hypothetical protein
MPAAAVAELATAGGNCVPNLPVYNEPIFAVCSLASCACVDGEVAERSAGVVSAIPLPSPHAASTATMAGMLNERATLPLRNGKWFIRALAGWSSTTAPLQVESVKSLWKSLAKQAMVKINHGDNHDIVFRAFSAENDDVGQCLRSEKSR